MNIPNINANSVADKIKVREVSIAKVKETIEQAKQEHHNEKEEIPVLKFAYEYSNILINKVIPEIAEYDLERKFKLKLAIISSMFFTVAGGIILIFSNSSEAVKLASVSFTLAFVVWETIKKKFEKKLKRLVMPKLMMAFPGFNWFENPTIEPHEINSIRIFANSVKTTKEFDDAFSGRYRDVDIDLAECEFSIKNGKSTIRIFRGAIIRLKMNKPFKGITIVRPKNSYMRCEDLKRLNLEEIKLEDVKFCKEYRVFSTDQIEARYLLTTSFIERFMSMTFSFFAKYSYCVFCNKYIYIAPEVNIDLFNLFSLRKPVTDRKQFDIMFNQIYSILEIVDHFKLDKKLGL